MTAIIMFIVMIMVEEAYSYDARATIKQKVDLRKLSTIYFKLADIARDNQAKNSKYGQNTGKK